MKYALIVITLLALFGAVLYGAWYLEESSKTVRTVVVEPSDDSIFTVDITKDAGAVLVVHCDEEDYLDAHALFLKKIGVEDVPLTCPGGPMTLAFASVDVIPADLAPAKRAFLEVVRGYMPKRIILIAHSDCFLYDVVGAWMDHRSELVVRQQADLRTARDLVAGWFRGVKVEMYYAELTGTQLKFKQVSESKEGKQ